MAIDADLLREALPTSVVYKDLPVSSFIVDAAMVEVPASGRYGLSTKQIVDALGSVGLKTTMSFVEAAKNPETLWLARQNVRSTAIGLFRQITLAEVVVPDPEAI